MTAVRLFVRPRTRTRIVCPFFTAFGTRLTLSINAPIVIDLQGASLNATLTGQLVAYTVIAPEPSSLVLVGFAACGLCWVGRRRLRRAERRSSSVK